MSKTSLTMYNTITKSIKLRGYITLLALIFTISLQAQNITVKGVVVDETDTPLIGATVMVKGASTGAITDFDGNFTLTTSKGSIISFSYIGYKTQEIKYTGQSPMNVKMVPDNKTLDEVVVVGYGSMKRGDLTGSVASVASKDIEGYKSSSVMGALGGQIAGVQITQTDGTPGAGFNINIRGVGTLTGDASPLYIVDGFQVDNIDYLSNSDIESIEVLKDASSAAIYGARAANGVVMVSTKSGKVGRPVINYNGSASYRKISKMLDVLSPYEFVKLQGEIKTEYANSYYKSGNDDNGIPYLYQSAEDYIGMKGVDWQEETFNPTWSQDHNLSISGGSDNTKYTASFSRYIENGIFKNSGFDKTTGKIRFNQKITKNITFDTTVNYAQTNRKGVGTSADSGRFNMLAQILSARPTGGLKLTDEELLNSAIDPEMLETGESLAQVNPVMQTESVTNNKRGEMWSANASVTWQIIKGLTFKTAGTYNTTDSRTDIFYKTGSKEAYRNGEKPYGRTQMGRDVRWTNYNNLTWKQKIKKHTYDVMLGHEVSFKSSEYLLGEAMDFPFDNLGNDNLGIGATPSKVSSSYNDKMLLSFFARGNYNYDNRYLLTATIRADGSTVFSQKNKWGYFPSFSAGWNFSKEKFMHFAEPVLQMAKLRASWGELGNQNVGDNYYPYLVAIESVDKAYPIGNQLNTGFAQLALGNANIKWETIRMLNIGIDLSLFNNRLTISADWFKKNNMDALVRPSLPLVLGKWQKDTSRDYLPLENLGEVESKGWELNIAWRDQIGQVKYRAFFNLSDSRNKIIDLGSSAPVLGDQIRRVGDPIDAYYGYRTDGLAQVEDFEGKDSFGNYINPKFPLIQDGVAVQPGDIKYKDISGPDGKPDGIIDDYDKEVIGNKAPRYSYSFKGELEWKGLDFSFYFQGVGKANGYLSEEARHCFINDYSVPKKSHLDRWTPENPNASYPRLYYAQTHNRRFSDYWIENAAYLRLKNIQLGYTLPQQWMRSWGISKLRVYVSADNLFTVTKYFDGFDPEVQQSSGDTYPQVKTYVFGLNLTF